MTMVTMAAFSSLLPSEASEKALPYTLRKSPLCGSQTGPGVFTVKHNTLSSKNQNNHALVGQIRVERREKTVRTGVNERTRSFQVQSHPYGSIHPAPALQ